MTREDAVMALAREEDAESLARGCAVIACRLGMVASLASERIVLSHALDAMRDALQARVEMERAARA